MNRMIRTRLSSGDSVNYFSSLVNSNWFNSPRASQRIKDEIAKFLIRPRFRVNILNSDETVRRTIAANDIVLGGSYNENYQSGQRRSVSLQLYNEMGKYTPSINTLWAGTKMSLDLGIELDNAEIIWFPKGIYNLSNISTTRAPGQNLVSLDLNDKFSILEGPEGTYETSLTIPPDTLIEGLLYDLLSESRGDGTMFDSKPIIIHSAFQGAKTKATITVEAGGNRGSVIGDIGTQLNAEYFYDVDGNLNLVPATETTADADKPLIYQFYEENGDFGSDNLSFDLSQIINRVVVVGANVNSQICDAVAVNDDPSSPLCYQRIGYRTAAPINDSNITSVILAQERADYELRQKLLLRSSVSHDVAFNPLLLVNNLIGVTDEFYNFQQEKFLIQSISCPLDYSGTMSVTSSNARNLPFVVGG